MVLTLWPLLHASLLFSIPSFLHSLTPPPLLCPLFPPFCQSPLVSFSFAFFLFQPYVFRFSWGLFSFVFSFFLRSFLSSSFFLLLLSFFLSSFFFSFFFPFLFSFSFPFVFLPLSFLSLFFPFLSYSLFFFRLLLKTFFVSSLFLFNTLSFPCFSLVFSVISSHFFMFFCFYIFLHYQLLSFPLFSCLLT